MATDGVPTDGARRWRARVLVGVVLLAPKLAQAEARAPRGLELAISYHAHPACPSGSTFLDVLRQHLATGGEGPVDGEVNIVRRPATGDFELRLRLHVLGRDYESVEHARSCETLMRLAALNAAIARTGAAASTASTPDEEGAAEEDSGRDPDDFGGAGPQLIPNAPARPGPEPELAARDELPSAPGFAAAEVARHPAAKRWFALAALRTTSSMLPKRAWGRAAVFGLARAPWSLRVTGTWWQSQRAELRRNGGSPIDLAFEQQSLELSPCWGKDLSNLLRVEGCASLLVNRAHTSAPETRFIGALGVGALASVRVWHALHLEIGGGLQLAPSPPYFLVRLGRVYQPERLEPVAQVAFGWEFGAREQQAAVPELAPQRLDGTRRAAQ